MTTPAPLGSLELRISIAAGWNHTCAATTAAGAKCWGYNHYGQLGNGNNTDSCILVDVRGLTSGVAAVAAVSTAAR